MKSCDLEALAKDGEGKKTDSVVSAHGGNCVTIWKVEVMGDKLAAVLERRGRMCLEIWSLVDG